VWVGTVNGASDGLSSAEDFSDSSGKVSGTGSWSHDSGAADDVIHGNVTVVLDVLDLLSVSDGLLERLDDDRRSGWDNRDLSLSVLDGQLDGDLETLPVSGGLADVVTDLLGGETERTDLWGERGSGTDFATNNSEVDLDDGGGIELWWHLFIRVLLDNRNRTQKWDESPCTLR